MTVHDEAWLTGEGQWPSTHERLATAVPLHKVSSDDLRASAMIAPLHLGKEMSRTKSNGAVSTHTRRSSSKSSKTQRTLSAKSKSNPSPPLTPRMSRDGVPPLPNTESTFHNYMRAFCAFHPASTVASEADASSVTVPINMGDVILVHSVHPNGWADGTLLASGERGWLPTNYCEAYDHETIRALLNALTQLWDLVRSNQVDNLAAFTRQDYVRAIIAGVRIFLEKTQCLNRESKLVQTHVGLRRLRKGLLGDLSALVKIAKRLQELVQSTAATRIVYEALDELVLKAFKVVIRAVRFLDIWSQDVSKSPTLDLPTQVQRPPTPPSDTQTEHVGESNIPSTNEQISDSQSQAGAECSQDLPQTWRESETAAPQVYSPTRSTSSTGITRHSSIAARRHSKRPSVAHRASYVGRTGSVRSQNLASERLNAAHDAFLGYIGSFIGLHLQSRSSTDLAHITQQSVIASRKLLLVADEVWERDDRRSSALEQAKDTMYAKLAELVQATKDILAPSAFEDDVFMPDQGKQLVLAATSCVRAAGDCVSKTRSVIEVIGDFEFEHVGLGLPETLFQDMGHGGPEASEATLDADDAESGQSSSKPLPAPPEVVELPPQPKTAPPPPPPQAALPTVTVQESKPLPKPPTQSPIQMLEDLNAGNTDHVPAPTAKRLSHNSLAEVSERSESPQVVVVVASTQNPAEPVQRSSLRAKRLSEKDVRSDSVNDSVAETSSTYPSSIRDDGASILSQNSTRATTPDRSPTTTQNTDSTLLSSFGSVSDLQSVTDDGGLEEVILEKTYANELIYNKEGQITGGSLPALVEKLTTHDSTPDNTFVTTFYLTFRLFTTPADFARALVDRFEYAGSTPRVGVPVRLRVYNVFKGWLESYWQADSDASALVVITDFANGQLKAVFPAAGERLGKLVSKVTERREGSIVPRLVSSIGKTSASTTVFTMQDGDVPAPIVSKGQLNALRHAQLGGAPCSVLDFDPLEIARQVTLIESRIFCAIAPEELLGSEWTKKIDTKAVNVRAMSTLSTDLANLVADTILHLEDPKKRARVIKHWIKVAGKCQDLNNYDSLMAIVCSLNSSMVLRLKRTWEHVSQKTKTKYDELVSIVDVGRNYAVLRQRLQNQVAPCIPFVGIYLTDLTFVDVGNQTTRQLPGDGSNEGLTVINFDKHMKTAKVIGQLQGFQVPYRLAAVPELQEWMQSLINRMRASEQANVQNYYRRSLLLEPREAPKPQPSPIEGSGSLSANGEKDKFDLFANLHFGSRNRNNSTMSLHQRLPSNS